eukprot:TRINITY_DN1880_c0_g1_i6.p1 TRINITY_DN1880_c0_g1~~TRINITY_DN1880_c0_g1_i6.p1  ORF type:complete len:228 (+),score=67.64 TRINITY_DN1880_c0_g1_i6:341-1024(+)
MVSKKWGEFFNAIALSESTEKAEWLVTTFLPLTPQRRQQALRSAVMTQSIEFTRWFATKYGVAKYEVQAVLDVLRLAQNRNLFRYLQWLTERFALSKSDAFVCGALQLACYTGNCQFVRWVLARFDVDAWKPEEQVCAAAEAINRACKDGHLDVAKYLWAALRLKPHDADLKNSALDAYYSIRYLRPGVAEWLIATFSLPVQEHDFDEGIPYDDLSDDSSVGEWSFV